MSTWQLINIHNFLVRNLEIIITNQMNCLCQCCYYRDNFSLSVADSKEISDKLSFKIMYSADWLEVIFKSGVEGRVTQENSALYIKHLVTNTTIADFVENVKNGEYRLQGLRT